jgi:ATP-grasp ribosomal peptide maturase
MAGLTVLIFTAELDVTAHAVIVELHARGATVFRCDPADFPTKITVGARFGPGWTGHLATATRTVDLSEVACAWWRRPGRISVPADVPEHDWARREAVAGLRGLLATLPWLNHPDDIRAAEHKPLQLATAGRVGLTVPATLLTNDPDEVRAFAKEHGPLVYKPLTGGLLDDGRVIYASPFDMSTVDDRVRTTAHLFQQQVPKAYELRVTVVDGRAFAARLDAGTEEGQRDWRADYAHVRYSPYRLPEPVADLLRRYLGRLRLRFAAIDMIVTPGGEYVFLEANPNGQWAWIEAETGLPIAAAIADALEGRPDVR